MSDAHKSDQTTTDAGASLGDGGLSEAARRKGSVWGTFKAVAWSFFGVRRSRDHAHDVSRLNPLHVVIAGLVAALLFVLGLVVLIQWVVNSGVAR